MQPEQLTLAHAVARRAAQEGMDRALQGAENKVSSWGEMAYAWLLAYAKKHQHFMGWMLVKASALDDGFPTPENEKAWGPVIKRAARAGVIVRDGTAKDPYRHCNPIPVWRSTVYGT